MNDLVVYAVGVIDDAFACYEVVPFGLEYDAFSAYALSQFQKRIDRIERARGTSLEEIERVTQAAIETEDS
jgi:ribonucleoside-diphosphate reductase beta chain